MTTEYMRVQISKVYDNPRWRDRVSCMPSYQVMAVYYDFKKRGLFNRPERLANINDAINAPYISKGVEEELTPEEKSYGWEAVQLTMDEFLQA